MKTSKRFGLRTYAARLAFCFFLLACGFCEARAERVMQFNGSGSLMIPLLDSFRFGASNDFCIEFWVKVTNASTETAALFTTETLGALSGA